MDREQSQDTKGERVYRVVGQMYDAGGILLKVDTQDLETTRKQILEDYPGMSSTEVLSDRGDSNEYMIQVN